MEVLHGSINLEVIGGSDNYTYDWDYDGTTDFDDPQDPTNLTAGFYTVVVDDGINPTITATIEIEEPISALVASSIATNLSCYGKNDGSIDASASGGTLPYRYEWSTGSIDEDILDLSTGTYTLTVTDAKGCISITSKTITEPAELIISGIVADDNCGPANNGAIDLTVNGGSFPYSVSWSNGGTTEDISGLEDGIYSVIVTDNAGCIRTATFSINKACIGISKELVGTPINHGDGSYSIMYDIGVENYGNVDLNNVQITEDLSNTFSAAIDFTLDAASIVRHPSVAWVLNSNFDGDTGDGDATDATDDEILNHLGSLLVGESAVIRLAVTVVPGSTLTYINSASAIGTTINGTTQTDISQNGNDPDPDNDGDPTNNNDPTPVTLEENPQIGLAKVLGETITNNHDATYSLNFNLRVENTGDVILKNIQITDDLQLTFPGLNLSHISGSIIKQPLNSVLVFNSNYDGHTAGDYSLLDGLGTLAVGEFAIINIDLTVEVDGSLGVFYNTASSIGTSPAENDVIDVSQDGIEVDPDNDGDPGNNSDPTPVSFLENPIVKINKTLSSVPINHGDGTFTIEYYLEVNNQGDVPILDLQVTDDLNAAFPGLIISNVTSSIITQPASTTLISNASYDGLSGSDINLLVSNGRLNFGETTIIRV